ncbi:MAG: glycosyltransferase family 4 protein [Solirubrobacteraceae bacterium]|nr:glycosyltransferase family 4 protein [Solirubrobacteraceae bacterium]
MTARPRVLFVGHHKTRLPLTAQDEKKWALLEERLDVRVLVADGGGPPHPRFVRLRTAWARGLRGAAFYAAIPAAVNREERRFRPDVIVAQSPYEAAMVQLARPRVPVICEVHGDWDTAATDYGSSIRDLLAVPAGAVARWGVRRADATRPVGPTMARLVRETTGKEPTRTFATWTDSDAYRIPPVQPIGERPTALFVGVLQPYKNPEVLAAAWPAVLEQVPDARLVIVGRGPQQPIVDALIARSGASVEHHEWLDAAEVRQQFDDAWFLALPSRSEGLPRVGIESLLRGRPIVGADAGGIPDLIDDGHTGLLVKERDVSDLTRALVRMLSDREATAAMAEAAAKSWGPFVLTPTGYADAVVDLVETVIADGR